MALGVLFCLDMVAIRAHKEFLSVGLTLLLALGLAGCSSSPLTSAEQQPQAQNSPELILRSGFEPGTSLFPVNANILGFQGKDLSQPPPNDWTAAMADPNIGDIYVQLASPGTTADRKAEIAADPLDPTNSTLHFWLANATEPDPLKGRVSTNIGENIGLTEASFKVRLFLPADFGKVRNFSYLPDDGNWLTLMELWSNPVWTIPAPFPFRITLYVIKSPDDKDLVFGVEAQSMDPGNWQTVWRLPNNSFLLPIGEWFDLETYYRDGDATTGRFFLAATRAGHPKTVLFDVTNFTRHPSNPAPTGLKWFNPMKLYASKPIIDSVSSQGGVLQAYWDDFEFWKNLPLPGSVGGVAQRPDASSADTAAAPAVSGDERNGVLYGIGGGTVAAVVACSIAWYTYRRRIVAAHRREFPPY